MAPSLADLRSWFYSAGPQGISFAQWQAFGGGSGETVSDAEYAYLTEAAALDFNAFQLMNLAPGDKIVAWGQSHCQIPAGRAIPDQLKLEYGIRLRNKSQGGQGWADLAPTIPTHLLPEISPECHNVLIILGGTQDIVEGTTGAATFDLVLDVLDAWKARVFETGGTTTVLAFTIPNALGLTGPQNVERDAHNALMMASTEFSVVIDIHTDPFDDPFSEVFWDFDHVHLSDAGVDEAMNRIPPVGTIPLVPLP